MQNDLLTPKIELLQEQIDNLERSGYFTEAEMDRATVSLRMEMELHKHHLGLNSVAESTNASSIFINEFTKALCSMTTEDYIEGMKYHNECFDQMKTPCPNNITVVAAEILTPSNQ
jgi:hypothetical protein